MIKKREKLKEKARMQRKLKKLKLRKKTEERVNLKNKMKLDKRRRIENKTNYTKRLKLLEAGHKRFVAIKTNRYLILQIVESDNASDKVIYSVNTKELLKHGLPKENANSLKSIPASYLGGYLLGKKIKDSKEMVILDSGLIANTSGSRIYAAVKGLNDAGIMIKYKMKKENMRSNMKGIQNKNFRANNMKNREEMSARQSAEHLENWIPKTNLGRIVKDKKITDIDEIL